MSSGLWESFLSRGLFFAAFLLLAIAVLERLVNYLGFTIVGSSYAPGRMLEFAGIMLLFVIALLLRQAREELRNRKA